jgi:hypothetical protein
MEIFTTASSIQLHDCLSKQHIIVYCLTSLYHILPIQLRESIHILQTIGISNIDAGITIFDFRVDLDNVLVEPRVSRCGEVDIGEQEVTRKNKPRLSIREKARLRELGGHVGECRFESADWCT